MADSIPTFFFDIIQSLKEGSQDFWENKDVCSVDCLCPDLCYSSFPFNLNNFLPKPMSNSVCNCITVITKALIRAERKACEVAVVGRVYVEKEEEKPREEGPRDFQDFAKILAYDLPITQECKTTDFLPTPQFLKEIVLKFLFEQYDSSPSSSTNAVKNGFLLLFKLYPHEVWRLPYFLYCIHFFVSKLGEDEPLYFKVLFTLKPADKSREQQTTLETY